MKIAKHIFGRCIYHIVEATVKQTEFVKNWDITGKDGELWRRKY